MQVPKVFFPGPAQDGLNLHSGNVSTAVHPDSIFNNKFTDRLMWKIYYINFNFLEIAKDSPLFMAAFINKFTTKLLS